MQPLEEAGRVPCSEGDNSKDLREKQERRSFCLKGQSHRYNLSGGRGELATVGLPRRGSQQDEGAHLPHVLLFSVWSSLHHEYFNKTRKCCCRLNGGPQRVVL